jgi:ribokinase
MSDSAVGNTEEAATSVPLQVVGLGYCAWDYSAIVDRIPEFDAPTVSLADFSTSGGGPVATALVTLARLDIQTGYVGAVGEDSAGAQVRLAFEQEGVDLERLRVWPGARTPVCMVLVQRQTGKRMILCYRGTAGELSLDEADRAYITTAPCLHLDGHHMSAAILAAQWMRQAGGIVVLDANRTRPRLDELLPWVDVLITNPSFPTAYTGERDVAIAAHELLRTGAKLVVTTLGDEGCLCVSDDDTLHVPGFAVEVVDTTGAGDAFHGAFIYGWLQGWNLQRKATFANAVAAMNCTALGGRAGLPGLEEVEAFLQSRGRGTGPGMPA